MNDIPTEFSCNHCGCWASRLEKGKAFPRQGYHLTTYPRVFKDYPSCFGGLLRLPNMN